MKNEAIELSSSAAAASSAHDSSSSLKSVDGRLIPHLLSQVLQRSNAVALKVYEKEVVTANSHLQLCIRYGFTYTESQMRALQSFYLWRDKVAREEDESTQYVCNNNVLVKYSKCHAY